MWSFNTLFLKYRNIFRSISWLFLVLSTFLNNCRVNYVFSSWNSLQPSLSMRHSVFLYYTRRKLRIFGDILLNCIIWSSKLVIKFLCNVNMPSKHFHTHISSFIFLKPDSFIDSLWIYELFSFLFYFECRNLQFPFSE